MPQSNRDGAHPTAGGGGGCFPRSHPTQSLKKAPRAGYPSLGKGALGLSDPIIYRLR